MPLLFAHFLSISLPHKQPWEHKHLDFIVASPQLNSGCLGRVRRVLWCQPEPSFPPQVTPDSENDFGNYNCTAVNRIGQESSEFILVQAGEQGGQAVPPGHTVALLCWLVLLGQQESSSKQAGHGFPAGLGLLSVSLPSFLHSLVPLCAPRALWQGSDLCPVHPKPRSEQLEWRIRAVPAPAGAPGLPRSRFGHGGALHCSALCRGQWGQSGTQDTSAGCFLLEKGLGGSSLLERR